MRKPIIYDIDDMIFIPHSSSANTFIRFLKYYKKIPLIMKVSSHIIVVTPYLKQFAGHFNKNVTYIPPTINTDKYFIKKKNYNEKICIGWTGSHSTSGYLLILDNALKNLKKKYDFKIKVIGDKNFKIDGLDIDSKDWSLDTEVKDIQDIDIGLYPLPKDEWVMGKGGLKALQYMGMGIPVVCSKLGAVLNFIEDGVNGFLAESDEEWVEKISRLIEDTELRKSMGLSGRKTVEEKFSLKINAPEYLHVIKSVL